MPWAADEDPLATRATSPAVREGCRGVSLRGAGRGRWGFARRYPRRDEAGHAGRCWKRGDLGNAFLLSVCCQIIGQARADAAPTGVPADVTSASHYTESVYNRVFFFLLFLCLVPFVAWAWGLLVSLTCPEGQNPDKAWYRCLFRRRAPVGPGGGEGEGEAERTEQEEHQLRRAVFMLFSLDTTEKEEEEEEEERRRIFTDLRRLRERRKAVTFRRASVLSADLSPDDSSQVRALLPITMETAAADGGDEAGSADSGTSREASRSSLKSSAGSPGDGPNPDEAKPASKAEMGSNKSVNSVYELLEGLDKERGGDIVVSSQQLAVGPCQTSAPEQKGEDPEEPKDKQANIEPRQTDSEWVSPATASRASSKENNSDGVEGGSCSNPPEPSTPKKSERAETTDTHTSEKEPDVGASPHASEQNHDLNRPGDGHPNSAPNVQNDANNSNNSGAVTISPSTLEQEKPTASIENDSKLAGAAEGAGGRDDTVGCRSKIDREPDTRDDSVQSRPASAENANQAADSAAETAGELEPAGPRTLAAGGALSPEMTSDSSDNQNRLAASAHLCNSIETIVL